MLDRILIVIFLLFVSLNINFFVLHNNAHSPNEGTTHWIMWQNKLYYNIHKHDTEQDATILVAEHLNSWIEVW
jgi:hypothetical protein